MLNEVAQDVVESPSLEILGAWLDMVPSNLTKVLSLRGPPHPGGRQDTQFLPKAFTSPQRETEAGQNKQEGREWCLSPVACVLWPLLLALPGAYTI